MSVSIENLTDKPIWLQLNSGQSLSIMPHSQRDVPEGEVRGNAKVKQLHDGKVIRATPPLAGDPDDDDSHDEDPDADSRSPGRGRKKKSS